MSVKSLKGTQSTNHIKPVASNWTPDNKDIALFMSALWHQYLDGEHGCITRQAHIFPKFLQNSKHSLILAYSA